MTTIQTRRLRLREFSTGDLDDMAALLGDHVKSSAQGQGYATEAALACRDHARSHGLAARVVSIIHHENATSRRVAEKVGMRLDRSLTHASPVHNVFAMDLTIG